MVRGITTRSVITAKVLVCVEKLTIATNKGTIAIQVVILGARCLAENITTSGSLNCTAEGSAINVHLSGLKILLKVGKVTHFLTHS